MSFLLFEDIDFIEIEVSEKIEEKNLKSFILSNLELNNKKYTITRYIKQYINVYYLDKIWKTVFCNVLRISIEKF